MVHNSPFGRAQCGHAACEEQSCLDYAALDEPAVPRTKRDDADARRVFAFEAACWPSCVGASLRLARVYRQARPLILSQPAAL